MTEQPGTPEQPLPPAAPQYGAPQTPPPAPQYPPAQPPVYGAQQQGYGAQQPGYGAPQPGYGAPYQAQPPLSDADRRLWATLAHAGGILIGFIAPLIVFLVYKDRDQWLRAQAVEALNFQITVAIALTVSSFLLILIIGIILLPAVWIASIIFAIIAAMAANNAKEYRYPMTLRLVS